MVLSHENKYINKYIAQNKKINKSIHQYKVGARQNFVFEKLKLLYIKDALNWTKVTKDFQRLFPQKHINQQNH